MTATSRTFILSVVPEQFAIVRLAPDAAIPAWAMQGAFCSVTRTADELSIVTARNNLPHEHVYSTCWRAFKLHGPFAFTEIGVVASLANPLAEAGVSIFVISTFDTDYLLVQSEQALRAFEAFHSAGHTILDTKLL